VRQLPQLKFQSAVRAGDARSAAAAALEALEPAVKAAMANIERASAGQGIVHSQCAWVCMVKHSVCQGC
jgi:cellobiose-specific phosphotransferase system component IIA